MPCRSGCSDFSKAFDFRCLFFIACRITDGVREKVASGAWDAILVCGKHTDGKGATVLHYVSTHQEVYNLAKSKAKTYTRRLLSRGVQGGAASCALVLGKRLRLNDKQQSSFEHMETHPMLPTQTTPQDDSAAPSSGHENDTTAVDDPADSATLEITNRHERFVSKRGRTEDGLESSEEADEHISKYCRNEGAQESSETLSGNEEEAETSCSMFHMTTFCGKTCYTQCDCDECCGECMPDII